MTGMDGVWLAAERARLVDAGQRLHDVPNEIVIAGLREQLDKHVGPGWWAMVLYSDGRGLGRGKHGGVRSPAQPLYDRIRGFAIALNRELHCGGHWVLALNKAQEIHCLWRDADGDLHGCMEVVGDGREKIENWKDADILPLGAKALAMISAKLEQLELRPDQQVKRAQGERGATH